MRKSILQPMDGENRQKGSILVMSLLITASITTIALTFASVMPTSFQISADVGRYVPAFYAADAGVERALYRVRKSSDQTIFTSGVFSNNASYSVCLSDPDATTCGAKCPAGVSKCIFSSGALELLSRRIQVSY